MTDERFQKLESLGFEFSRLKSPKGAVGPSWTRPAEMLGKSNDEIWRMRFDDLKAFKAQNGHANGYVRLRTSVIHLLSCDYSLSRFMLCCCNWFSEFLK
jgi:hypothetical protein